jgi:riboflavin kinase/FMN adenylyltransferase
MNKKIYALGFFDGVHLGHQALLDACVKLAQAHSATPAAITFQQHPQSLFSAQIPALINANPDRDTLLTRYGMEYIHRLEVNEEIMSTNWRDFLENLRAEGAIGFVCGDDFRFGHKGQGDTQKLVDFCRAYALPCVIVPEQTKDGIRISSTHIRNLIEQGDMETAAQFLGHPHILSGEVVSGRQIGRTIGIPTANILIPEGVVTPKLGVYACICRIDDATHLSVTNIGSRPTVEGHQIRAESWILDFDGDLYGKRITLEFYNFLRPERKFDSLEELRQEILENAQQTQTLLMGRY